MTPLACLSVSLLFGMRSPLLDLRPRSVRTRGSSGSFATATVPHLIYISSTSTYLLTHFMPFLYMVPVPFRRRSALNPFTSFIVGAILRVLHVQ